MKTWTYDGTFESFLTALSLALERPEDCAIAREGAAEPGLFSEFAAAGADRARAAAARDLFERRGSAESWHHARYAFLSERPGAEDAVLAYARLIKEKGAAADNMRRRPGKTRARPVPLCGRRGAHVQRLRALL